MRRLPRSRAFTPGKVSRSRLRVAPETFPPTQGAERFQDPTRPANMPMENAPPPKREDAHQVFADHRVVPVMDSHSIRSLMERNAPPGRALTILLRTFCDDMTPMREEGELLGLVTSSFIFGPFPRREDRANIGRLLLHVGRADIQQFS